MERTKRSAIALQVGARGFSRTKRRGFLVAYALNDDPRPAFWQAMQRHEDFGEGLVNRLQLAIQLAGVTANHLPLTKDLLAMQRIFGMVPQYQKYPAPYLSTRLPTPHHSAGKQL